MNLGYGWERAKEECKESTAKTEWQCLHSALGAYLCDGLRKHHERSLQVDLYKVKISEDILARKGYDEK